MYSKNDRNTGEHYALFSRRESRADSMVVCMALAVLVALGSFQVLADDMEVAGFVENATYNRRATGFQVPQYRAGGICRISVALSIHPV